MCLIYICSKPILSHAIIYMRMLISCFKENSDVMVQDSNMGELRIVYPAMRRLSFQMDLRMLQREFPNRRFWGVRPGIWEIVRHPNL